MTGSLPGGASRAVRFVLAVLLVALATGLTARPATAQEAATPTDTPASESSGEAVVLGVDLDDDVEEAVPHGGGSYTYTITVANRGTAKASEVSMVDELPSGLSVTGVRAPGPWTCVLPSQQVSRDADEDPSGQPTTPGQLYCSLDTLAAGASAPPLVVDVEVAEDFSGQLEYRVQATSAESGPADDSETTMVAAQQQPAQLAVDLVDDVEDSVAFGGAEFAYTITVSNPGPVAVTEVSVADALPAAVRVTGVHAPGPWTCVLPSEDGTGEQLYCMLDGLAAGASAPPLVVDVEVAEDFSGQLENTVEADSAETDPVGATTTTTVDVETRVLGNVLEKPASSPAAQASQTDPQAAPQVLTAQEAQPELARTGPWADHLHLVWAAALALSLGALLLRASRPVTARR